MRGYRFLSLGLLLAVISGVLDCSDPPNPFLDITKSRASVYSKTFEDRDTIPIFSFETLTVAIYLKEHLREVSVHIDHNRLGTSDDTIISIDSYDGDLVFIPFSFYDTGWQHIEVRSLKNTGEIVSEKYELYAMSPLYQKTIRGRTGESVRLKTTPVEDKSVIYVWDFHNGTVIKDYSNEVSIVLSKNFTSTIGELYVTDPLSKSPSVPFSIDTGAINKLEIICQNDSLLFDSVYTGQSNFTFKVLVNGAGHLSSATVNGEPFDVVVSSNGSFMINKMFNRLDTVQGAIRAAVSVTDDLDRFVEKVFYIHYNNAVSAATPKIILNIPATLNDTGYVMLQKVALFGEIRGNITVNQLFIQVFLNGKFAGAQKILPPGYSWTFPVQLNNSWNSVQFQLTKDSLLVDSVMAVKTVALNSNPDEIDKIPPVINQIKIDGVIANREKNVIRNKDVLMSILVSDNKRVSFVTVNGNRADSDSNNLLFTAQISLEHSTVGVPYIVCAEDSDGNKTCDTVTVSYNNIPEITDYRIPSTMIVDTEYVFTVNATDPDKDSLITTITLKGGAVDTVLTLLNSTVRWKPSLKDTGALQLKIHVFDPFFESADLVQTVYVIVQKNQAVPVSIRTTADDFPDTLFVGGSPLTVLLHVDTLTGTPPVSFTVYLKNQSRKIYDSSNPMFVWSPVRSDAGVQTLQVVAHDKSAFSDTLT
ncbi:MAG: hypothetical protein GX640_20595, partial [Fibrobacter sp.]|nr:hypothetical protein [Fibrobacter sp.]